MQKIAIVVLVLAIGAASRVIAQAKPDFGGKWVIDTDKSLRPDSPPGAYGFNANLALSVAQTATTLVVTQSVGSRVDTATYKLDGAESTNPGRAARGASGGAPVNAVYRSRWVGAKLVTTITQPGTQGPLVTTETRYLEAGEMVVEREGGGQPRIKYYWKKA